MVQESRYSEFMEEAILLASKGWGRVSPNPMVGALIVKNGEVIAKGYHRAAGLEHAEVMALRTAGKRAKGATLIVNLEPCAHHGKTPPCTDAIVKAGILKVVYGMKDPNPLVSGKGLAELKKAKIKIVGPVLERKCKSLNRIYYHWMKTGLPFLISKVAISLDGKIAAKNGDSKWITGEKCRKRIHYWRSGVDAVLVGAKTLRKDDSLLNARGMKNVKQPVPVIVTQSGRLPKNLRVWKRKEKPIVISSKPAGKRIAWREILRRLGEKGVTSIFVEGGADVHSQLINEKIPDYCVASVSMKLIGGDGLDWLSGFNADSVKDSPKIKPDQILILDGDIVIEGELEY